MPVAAAGLHAQHETDAALVQPIAHFDVLERLAACARPRRRNDAKPPSNCGRSEIVRSSASRNSCATIGPDHVEVAERLVEPAKRGHRQLSMSCARLLDRPSSGASASARRHRSGRSRGSDSMSANVRVSVVHARESTRGRRRRALRRSVEWPCYTIAPLATRAAPPSRGPPMALLEIRNVTRRFGDFTAVDGVSLAIEAGEFFTLLGPSGCGKTTLLRMIAGFDLPDGGSILLDGERSRRPAARKTRPVRTVFQSYALFPHMTVEGNVAFPLKMAKTPAARSAAKVAEALDRRAAHRLRQALPARALRRAEAARRDRARARHASDGAAARRAAGRARRQAARGDADRAHQPAEGGRHHVRLRDARPDRGARAVAPDRGDERRPRRAGGRAVAHLRLSADRASSPTSSATAICCPGRSSRNADGIVTVDVDGLGPVRVAAASTLARGPARHRRASPREDPHRARPPRAAAPDNAFRGTVAELLYMGDVTVYIVDTPGGRKIEALLANSASGRAKFFEVGDAVEMSWPQRRRPLHRGMSDGGARVASGSAKWLVSGPPLALPARVLRDPDADHGAGVVPHARRVRRPRAARRRGRASSTSTSTATRASSPSRSTPQVFLKSVVVCARDHAALPRRSRIRWPR